MQSGAEVHSEGRQRIAEPVAWVEASRWHSLCLRHPQAT